MTYFGRLKQLSLGLVELLVEVDEQVEPVRDAEVLEHGPLDFGHREVARDLVVLRRKKTSSPKLFFVNDRFSSPCGRSRSCRP